MVRWRWMSLGLANHPWLSSICRCLKTAPGNYRQAGIPLIDNDQTPNQSTIVSHKRRVTRALFGTAALLLLCGAVQQVNGQSFGPAPFLPSPVQVVSTIPSNGDINPYGVAFVPRGFPGGV